jgi:hypothetical protein
MSPATPILLLVASNVFMTVAWYGHLLFKGASLPVVILASWLIALPEYCLAVPANRFGHLSQGGAYTAPQLKIVQEGISITVFLAFTLWVLHETPRWQDLLAFGLILAGLAVALLTRATPAT